MSTSQEKFVVELEKKGRTRGRFVTFHRPWSKRKFILNYQSWDYYDGDVLKGKISVAQCKVKLLVPSEAENKSFPFQLELRSGEIILLSAAFDAARAITMQWLLYASNTGEIKAPFVFGSALSPVNISTLTRGKVVDHNSLYEGELVGGWISGKGLLLGIDGSVIDGNFLNGKLHGHSKVDTTTVNGCTFEGEFEMNLMEGYGVATFPNGDVYRGNYHLGKCHGYGGRYHKSGGYYEGNWVEGSKVGSGKMRTSNGGVFIGLFEDSAAKEGIWVYATGEIHVGYFGHTMKDNVLVFFKHGLGKNYQPNGDVREGLWLDGEFQSSERTRSDSLDRIAKVYKELEHDHSNYDKLQTILHGPTDAQRADVQLSMKLFQTAVHSIAAEVHTVVQDVVRVHDTIAHTANNVFTLLR